MKILLLSGGLDSSYLLHNIVKNREDFMILRETGNCISEDQRLMEDESITKLYSFLENKYSPDYDLKKDKEIIFQNNQVRIPLNYNYDLGVSRQQLLFVSTMIECIATIGISEVTFVIGALADDAMGNMISFGEYLNSVSNNILNINVEYPLHNHCKHHLIFKILKEAPELLDISSWCEGYSCKIGCICTSCFKMYTSILDLSVFTKLDKDDIEILNTNLKSKGYSFNKKNDNFKISYRNINTKIKDYFKKEDIPDIDVVTDK